MINSSLFIKIITKTIDRNGNVYYQLVLNELSHTSPEDDVLFFFPNDQGFRINVFSNSGFVLVQYFINMGQDDPVTGTPGLEEAIDLMSNYWDWEPAYITSQRVHLYKALSLGKIKEGYLLYGQIVKRRVEAYSINGKTAKYYTLPMLWDDLYLTYAQKEERIRREFKWKGRILAEGTVEEWIEEDEKERREKYEVNNKYKITNIDAFDSPDDYWNID